MRIKSKKVTKMRNKFVFKHWPHCIWFEIIWIF